MLIPDLFLFEIHSKGKFKGKFIIFEKLKLINAKTSFIGYASLRTAVMFRLHILDVQLTIKLLSRDDI